jgi:hypothetical protein
MLQFSPGFQLSRYQGDALEVDDVIPSCPVLAVLESLVGSRAPDLGHVAKRRPGGDGFPYFITHPEAGIPQVDPRADLDQPASERAPQTLPLFLQDHQQHPTPP